MQTCISCLSEDRNAEDVPNARPQDRAPGTCPGEPDPVEAGVESISVSNANSALCMTA